MGEIADVQTPVTNHAKATGWLARRVRYIGRNGAPDTWYLKRGIWLIFEFKNLGEPPNVQQEREIGRLKRAGAKVFVIDDADKGIYLLDRFSQKIRDGEL